MFRAFGMSVDALFEVVRDAGVLGGADEASLRSRDSDHWGER